MKEKADLSYIEKAIKSVEEYEAQGEAIIDAIQDISESQLVYLVTVFINDKQKNYLFKKREDAIKLMEKHYYMKKDYRSSDKWEDGERYAILESIFIREYLD